MNDTTYNNWGAFIARDIQEGRFSIHTMFVSSQYSIHLSFKSGGMFKLKHPFTDLAKALKTIGWINKALAERATSGLNIEHWEKII